MAGPIDHSPVATALPVDKHLQTAPLKRTADPVTVAAKNFSAWESPQIKNLGLYRLADHSLQLIPFQVDEKNKDGDWVFPYGKEANPETGNQRFDGQDELVFLARDTGPRSAKAPDLPGARNIAEICVSDPEGGAAYAYLILFSETAPNSPQDYVQYDPCKKEVSSDCYHLKFHPDFPLSISQLTTLPAAGGDGNNYIDRMKIRLKAKARFGIRVSRNEEDFTSVDLAYIDGPIRVIRRTRNRMVLFLSIPTPSAIMDNVYYRDFFSIPSEVNIPFNVGLVLKKAALHTSIDLKPQTGTRRFYNSNNPEGVEIDGHPSEQEEQLDRSPFVWTAQAVNDPENNRHFGWVKRLRIDKEVADIVQPALYYRDDLKTPDPPETHAGHYGDVGFIINDLTRLESGVYQLEILMYCVPEYEPGDEAACLKILDRPLTTTIRTVK